MRAPRKSHLQMQSLIREMVGGPSLESEYKQLGCSEKNGLQSCLRDGEPVIEIDDAPSHA